jgi:O-antigen ligase
VNRETLDRWCERAIVGLVLAILIFGPLATGAVRAQDFLIIQGATALVMALWAARFWISPRPRLLWPPICWGVLAFTLYAIGRYLTAEIEYLARQELIRVLVYMFLFFAILNNLHRQETIQILVFSLVFLAMGISCYAIFQFMTNSNRVWSYYTPYFHRGSGTYISPNHLAGFLEMVLPLGLAYTLASRLKSLPRIFLGYASLVVLGGIAVSLSRGGWLATIFALAIFFSLLLLHRTYRLPALVVLIALVGLTAYVGRNAVIVRDRIERIFASGRLDDDMRFSLWRPATRLWLDHPWFGAGPAHFDVRFAEYRPVEVQMRPDRVHNDYLNTLADWGAVGLALVLAVVALLMAGVVKTWNFVRGTASDLGNKSSNKFAFVIGASTGVAAILVHSVVDFNMHIPANAILLICLMALLSSHLRFATERYWIGAGIWIRSLATVLLVAGLVFLCMQGTHRAIEARWLDRAETLDQNPPAQAACLERAFQADPHNGETAYGIGEALRLQSFYGGDDWQQLASNSITWYKRGFELNPYDRYSALGCGTSLDWLGNHDEAWPWFQKANALDQNGYYTAAKTGWHYIQVQDYPAAKFWFERSLHLQYATNDIALSYMPIVNRILMDSATNDLRSKLLFPKP